MKFIVITGGGSGVGLAIARDLSAHNQVILVGRNEKKLQLAQKSLGDNVRYVAGNLATISGREKVVDFILTISLQKLFDNSRVLIVTGNPQAIKIAPICELQLNDMMRAAWAVTHKTLLMHLLADELAASQTTVNSFFPGDVKSDLMPYTQSLTNTTVPAGKLLALDAKFEHVTANFFDDNGQTVKLSAEKYNKSVAVMVLSNYIPELKA